jgi:outer membrane protein TolC
MPELSDHTPELARLRAEQDAAESRRELARFEGYPSFSLGANYIQTGGRTGVPDAGTDPWNVMLAVRIPLWRGAVQAEREEARAKVREAERALAWKRNELRADLESASVARGDALRRLKLYGEELLGLAEQAVENSRAAYESGRVGILEVIDSERSLLDLRRLYWRAAADAHIHNVTIETLTTKSGEVGTTEGTKTREAIP